ncbi:Cation-transporting ATPase [Spironucleus salmonicida]|uniref:Cation-transporting ATPase n=1 Tax=Spironucleus salmonicida TaxID=348837 RepID=V6LEI0_9EUKA|nr:Cation-transporting ATPase [Spironucleus salmonicida]|eukprot:EST42658.1 Cation-transporting ATPase [Spironucleus salmonicida]
MRIEAELLRPRKFRFFLILLYLVYIIYFCILYYVRSLTVSKFFQLPEDDQVLHYSSEEIDMAKQFNQVLDPIKLSPSNILFRWSHTDLYDGTKLLLLLPVAVHLIYLLFVHWSDSFRARAIFVQTNNPDLAHFAKLRIFTDETSSRIVLVKVKHQIYMKNQVQQIEFEGEKYQLILEDGILRLRTLYENYDISQFDLTSRSLTSKQHYQSIVDYGENRIILNYPNYLHILKDQILSPYFAFQIFTSVLYAVDNFATYSIFSIAMLIFVEGANVFQKFNSLKQTVKLAPQPVLVCVRREDTEQYVSSSSLVPGDTILFYKKDYSHDNVAAVGKQKKTQPTYNPLHQIAGFKVMQKFQEILFAKYYDEGICKHLNKTKFSHVFPVDMVITQGQLIADESILTGEQTSQIKEAIDNEQIQDTSLISSYNKVFGGTYLIQIQSDFVEGIVTKTAGQTEQGTLIKTIAFNEERMNVTTKDSLVFLLIMFVVATISAVYCFIRGYQSKIATISKLSLETLMVLVNVIPPDLPTELSMCISNSIREIRKKKIFSTEPYRILNAGRLSYVCFDKSGTLTQSDIKVLGVDDQLSSTSVKNILEKVKLQQQKFTTSELATVTISACQSINIVNGKFFGDILEVNAFKAIDSQVLDVNTVQVKNNKIDIIKRFYFNSNLKRMSVVAKYKGKQYIFAKGGPEIIQQLLVNVPQYYDKTVETYVKRGLRVLALAYREINYDNQPRTEIEQNLIFLGLLICQTPLKLDTAAAIQTLHASNHKLKVISGDHVLNVAITAQQCGIIGSQQIYIINDLIDGKYLCNELASNEEMQLTVEELIQSQFAFCLTNSNQMLELCIKNKKIIEKVTVFARTTPVQKQLIISSMKGDSEGKVAFVGDGCNDLNALQAADVGIALMEEVCEEVKQAEEKQAVPYPSIMGPNNAPAPFQQIVAEAQMRAQRKNTGYRQELQILIAEQTHYKRFLAFQKRKDKGGIMSMWSEALEQEEENEDIKMGDAAIAAQFTVKSGSLNGVLDIIRQGRCALTTVQMNFKTTALQCLIGAYSMTAMTLSGVRQSDAQLIASSLLSMIVLMNISKAKESKIISKVKPPKTITGPYLVLSMFGQAIIHISSLWYAQSLGGAVHKTVGFGVKFEPSQVNTIVFYVRLFLDACVTLVNFPGRPHMQAITEHRPVVLGICGYVIAMIALMFEQIPDLNSQLGLLSLDEAVRFKILICCFIDFVGCYVIEEFCKKTF